MSAGPSTTADAAAPAAGARSLADDIRSRTDEQLAALVLRRPDLARPAPSDLTSLAARAGTRASVQRAIESLDRGHLQVLEAVVVAGDGSASGSVDELMGGLDVHAELQDLWDLALVWRAPEGLYAVRTAPEVLGAHPAGLGPSSLELGARPLPAHEIRALVAEAPESARGVLDRLVWGPPIGVVNRDAPGSEGVRWLLDHRLLHVVAPTVTERARGETETRVLLPREVALLLRGGRLHEAVALTPPDAVTTPVGVERVDAAAGGEVSDLLALVEEAIELGGRAPPRVLRTGGLAVRDLRRLSEALDVDSTRAAWLVELMYGAGLLADDGELVPVVGADPGRRRVAARRRPEQRWARAGGRLAARPPGPPTWSGSRLGRVLVTGQRPRPRPALAAGPRRCAPTSSPSWPGCAPGDVATAGVAAGPAALAPTAARTRPASATRWPPCSGEAEWLGVTGRGGLSTAGRALVAGEEVDGGRRDDGQPAARTRRPRPGPGRPHGHRARTAARAGWPSSCAWSPTSSPAAAPPSTGSPRPRCVGPSTPGGPPTSCSSRCAAPAARGLPQPLDYLVRDVARRHGQTRVGRRDRIHPQRRRVDPGVAAGRARR